MNSILNSRINGIKAMLGSNEAAIITNSENRFYFTGMRSSAGTVLITPKGCYLLIDFRYYEKAKKVSQCAEVILCERLYTQLNELLRLDNIKKIYIESDTVTLTQFSHFSKNLADFDLSDSRILSEKIKKLREIKSVQEIESIKKAQAITDRTFAYILNRIKAGVTEKQIMLDMEFFARKHGSEGVAFDFIVVSGKNSSLPHGVPTEKKIENGDFVTMDFGAVVNGYRSDMTRTVAVGSVTDKQHFVYDTVLQAQKAALKAIKPGAECFEIDKIARDIIADAGYGDCFGHGLGHSVGLDIHETPACNTRDDTLLESGMIMTVEPGIYIENEFGVRIEDMVVLTDNGCVDITESPKELIIL